MVTSRAQGGLGLREIGKLGPNSLLTWEGRAVMTDPPVRMAPGILVSPCTVTSRLLVGTLIPTMMSPPITDRQSPNYFYLLSSHHEAFSRQMLNPSDLVILHVKQCSVETGIRLRRLGHV
jgi:hypothetical protein